MQACDAPLLTDMPQTTVAVLTCITKLPTQKANTVKTSNVTASNALFLLLNRLPCGRAWAWLASVLLHDSRRSLFTAGRYLSKIFYLSARGEKHATSLQGDRVIDRTTIRVMRQLCHELGRPRLLHQAQGASLLPMKCINTPDEVGLPLISGWGFVRNYCRQVPYCNQARAKILISSSSAPCKWAMAIASCDALTSCD